MDALERMPGDAEAAAAIAALNGNHWSVGDRLHFTWLPDGVVTPLAARVAWIDARDWLVVEGEDGSGFYVIPPSAVKGF